MVKVYDMVTFEACSHDDAATSMPQHDHLPREIDHSEPRLALQQVQTPAQHQLQLPLGLADSDIAQFLDKQFLDK